MAIRSCVQANKSGSAEDQSSQETSLSCEWALLLPDCDWPNSAPIDNIGVPRASSSVATNARWSDPLAAEIAGSAVAPSVPLFHDRLSPVPSRLPSPLASLFLYSYETRSANVKPSWAVMKLMPRDGRRLPAN